MIKHKFVKAFSVVAAMTGILATQVVSAGTKNITLDYNDLFSGHKAYKVILDQADKNIQLDSRVFKFGQEQKGEILTDPISLVPQCAGIDVPAKLEKLDITLKADVPDSTSVSVLARTGPHPYDYTEWTDWKQLPGLSVSLENEIKQFIELKIILSSENKGLLPKISSVSLSVKYSDKLKPPANIGMIDSDTQTIITSPIVFNYEKPDNPEIVNFAKDANLNEVVSGLENDFDRLVALMDWVASVNNDRKERKHRTDEGYYAWDINKVFEIREVEKDGEKVKEPTIYGHCMSYSEVMISAATALGYKARHLADIGFRDACHEIVEAWVPSLNKWVYFDPSLSNYYYDKKTREPLNIIQMHNIVKDNFIPEGKNMHWFTSHKSKETREYVRKIGGKSPIGARLGSSLYGEPMPEDYDWGWRHGYLAAGFVQMTPRNDFHSQPDANPKKFGSYAGFANYPFWVDEKTPPRKKSVGNWYTRMRDFYWTLDQATFRLSYIEKQDKTLVVMLGNSMPFFSKYRLTINGEESSTAASMYRWNLKPGINTIKVCPINRYGMEGTGSSATIIYHE